MTCLIFLNNYFDKAVVTVQGSFARDIRHTYFKNSLLQQPELDIHWKSEKEIRKDC